MIKNSTTLVYAVQHGKTLWHVFPVFDFVISFFVVFIYSYISAPEAAERGENVIREPPAVVDPDFGCIAATPPTKKH